MKIDLTGKIALVAGGTGGLGKAVTLTLLQEGCRVIATYRNAESFASLKKEASAYASLLDGAQMEASDEVSVAAVVDGIVRDHARLDIVVNCVGGYAGGLSLWDTSTAIFDRMLELNLRAGFVLARGAVPVLVRQGSGVFINVASKAALDHAAGASAYAASKSAAVAMMDALSADTRNTGVRINSILPSIIDTAVNREAMPAASFDRWPKPEQIAQVIVFLSSDQSSVIHGAAIPVYGDS